MRLSIGLILSFLWLPTGVMASAPVPGATHTPPMVIRYADEDPGYQPKNAYKIALYKLLLEVTKPEFGDYEIAPYTGAKSAKRQAALLAGGELLNMLWASPGTPIAGANTLVVPVDILRGLLGYRICLTTREQESVFAKVANLETLNAISIGQVDSWADVDIYEHNRINLVKTASHEGLFNMLGAHRFECLALGADEIVAIYNSKIVEMPELVIEKSLIIYYDFPIYLYVSAKHPEIAQRLKRGFQIIQENGAFKRLFDEFHQSALESLGLSSRKILCLKSPFIAEGQQCAHLEKFKL